MIDWTKWKLVPVEATDAMLCAALEQASVEIQYDGSTTIADAEYTLQQLITDAIAAAPQAPVVEVTDEVAQRVCFAEMKIDRTQSWPPVRGRAMIAAVRSELGPMLGLVELREPTPEECRRIENQFILMNMRLETSPDRDMFDAVRAVMFPQKSEVGL